MDFAILLLLTITGLLVFGYKHVNKHIIQKVRKQHDLITTTGIHGRHYNRTIQFHTLFRLYCNLEREKQQQKLLKLIKKNKIEYKKN